MRDWLVQQGIIKPEARLRRDELLKHIEYVEFTATEISPHSSE